MIDNLIEMIKEHDIQILSIQYEESLLYYTYNNDRIYFYHVIESLAEELIDFNIVVSSFINENARKFITSIGLNYSKESDVIELKTPDVKSILWEMYTVGIYINDGSTTLSEHKKHEIERDMIVSRKLFVDVPNITSACKEISKIIMPENEFDEIFAHQMKSNDERDVVDAIVKNVNAIDDIENVTWEKYDDIYKFLKSI